MEVLPLRYFFEVVLPWSVHYKIKQLHKAVFLRLRVQRFPMEVADLKKVTVGVTRVSGGEKYCK